MLAIGIMDVVVVEMMVVVVQAEADVHITGMIWALMTITGEVFPTEMVGPRGSKLDTERTGVEHKWQGCECCSASIEGC